MILLVVLFIFVDLWLFMGVYVYLGGIEEVIVVGMVIGLVILEVFLKWWVCIYGLLMVFIVVVVYWGELVVDDVDWEIDVCILVFVVRYVLCSQGCGLIRLVWWVWFDFGWEELGLRLYLVVVVGWVGVLSGLVFEYNVLYFVYIIMIGLVIVVQ